MSKCSADETPVCCCMDVGTIMDNTDCTASYSRVLRTVPRQKKRSPH